MPEEVKRGKLLPFGSIFQSSTFFKVLQPLRCPSPHPQALSDVRAQSNDADSTLQMDWACSCSSGRQETSLLARLGDQHSFLGSMLIQSSVSHPYWPSWCTGTPRCCTPPALSLWSSAPADSCRCRGRRRSTACAQSGTEGADAEPPGRK